MRHLSGIGMETTPIKEGVCADWDKKPVVGFFSFSCCQGCQFTVLFLDNLIEVFDRMDVRYFNLLKEESGYKGKFDLVFVEGAITTKDQLKELKKIRKKSKYVVAIGACACHGGIPAMRNFLETDELKKYVYNQCMPEDSINASGIGKHIKVDYYMYGCPIIKEEFVNLITSFCDRSFPKPFKGPVCNECPRRGKDCYIAHKKICLGAVTHGGCNAVCVRQNVPCVLCRGPLKTANFPAEIKLFKNFGYEEKDIWNKINKFKNVQAGNCPIR